MNDKFYADLLNGVRTWSANGPEFDTVGVLHLLRAAAENLLDHKEQVNLDPESLCEIFSPEEISLLEEVIAAARLASTTR
ncbi:MAG: hypothetical protein ABMB14_39625 [Myxococcota bacterium]